MNPHDVAAELRAREEKARVRGSRIAARTGRADYQEGKADGLDEAASLVESSQEARRVCTCNAIDTPHGPAPDEKTPGCPVHSPAPAEEDREQLRRGARQDAAHHREATRVARAEGRDAG